MIRKICIFLLTLVLALGLFSGCGKTVGEIAGNVADAAMEELEKRLRGRGDTPEDQIAMRLERAKWELEQKQKYNHVVVNDEAQACADQILHIIAQADMK